jgi:hypothetical protein
MATYSCPMHGDVHESAAANCPKCGMRLLPEGTRFALFQHMASRPLHVIAMIALMAVLMAVAMMLTR